MKNTIWKLHNEIKHYDWGSIDALTQLFDIPNLDKKPLAEIWMGAHPAGVSIAINTEGEKTQLDQLIANNPYDILGEKTVNQYASLPYLFKILSAQEPLSIQVHPEINKAKRGFDKENQLGIPLNSPNRNYKDPNHKPELIYALTPFWAMNGFRPITEIIYLFTQLNIQSLQHEVNELVKNRSDIGLKSFFYYLLTLDNETKQQAILELKSKIEPLNSAPFNIIKDMIKKYPNDNGVFSPLILNVIELQPGQAMFLKAQTPHAYLKGTGLEIMANSDNVLRAGLTSKHIDIDELLDNTTFHSISIDDLLTQPIKHDNKIDFPVLAVNDFAFEIISSTQDKSLTQKINSAEILLCIEGEITISTLTDSFTIKKGESVFIACCAKSFYYQGNGIFARAFNH